MAFWYDGLRGDRGQFNGGQYSTQVIFLAGLAGFGAESANGKAYQANQLMAANVTAFT